MESEEIIRAYMLEVNDIFKIGMVYFQVCKIENGQIYYCYCGENYSGKNGKRITMGANSQERLILITNKTKQNEH